MTFFASTLWHVQVMCWIAYAISALSFVTTVQAYIKMRQYRSDAQELHELLEYLKEQSSLSQRSE